MSNPDDPTPSQRPSQVTPQAGSNSTPRTVNARWVPPTPLELQEQIPQYKILEMIGLGGMGAVFQGWQVSLERYVAIKILPPNIIDDGENFAQRFQQEARTMAKMTHPGIVSVYDAGQTAQGWLYFVMEYIEGEDVSQILKRKGSLSGDYALAITAHVCDALHYAHSRGVVHRDIKPANIMLKSDGTVKVADFGLAKAANAGNSGLTKSNISMGTPDYIAPEALVMGVYADHRADIYALGVMLYQMLTGKVPRGMCAPPSQRKPGVDPRFDPIVIRAMKEEREERYQNVADMRRALDVILTSPHVEEAPAAAAPIVAETAAEAAPKSETLKPKPAAALNTEEGAGAPKKASAGMMAGVIGGVVALTIGGWFIFGPKKEKPAKPIPAEVTSNPTVDNGTTKVTNPAPPSSSNIPPTNTTSPANPTTPSPSTTGSTNTTASSTKPAPTPAPDSMDGWIDLLAAVDVNRDRIEGNWSKKGAELMLEGANAVCVLELNASVPEEYDFAVEFTPTSAGSYISQVLTTRGRNFNWTMNATYDGKLPPLFALERLHGGAIWESTEACTDIGGHLKIGIRYRSVVEVRRDSVRAFLNGKELVNWTGDQLSRFRGPTQLRDQRHLGLCGYRRGVVFHMAALRPLGKAAGGGK